MDVTRRKMLKYAAATAAAAVMAPARGALKGESVSATLAEHATPIPLSLPASDPLALLDATAQAELLRRHEASALELVDAAIRRIEALNSHLNAVVAGRFERARDEARRLGPGVGALRGVPALLQDLHVAGEPNALGSRLLAIAGAVPQHDDALLDRIRRSGMVVLGTTNMAELGCAPTTESRLWGAARNPWNLRHTPGGAGGGAAAAVASLMVPAAQTSDEGGSLRLPAAATGLVGLKVSRGRISAAPHAAGWSDIMATRGWLARSVRDSAALLDISAGPAPGDSMVAPSPIGAYAALLSRSTGTLRVGIMRELPGAGVPVGPAARAAVDTTAKLLNDLGHRVEEASPAPFRSTEHEEIAAAWEAMRVAQRVAAAERRLRRPIAASELEPEVYAHYRQARAMPLADFARVQQQAQNYSRRSLQWWREGYDILLCPTAGCEAPELGMLTDMDAEATRSLRARWTGFLPMASITGQPAITLPLFESEQKLPIGIQLVADLWCEDQLLQLAAELERVRPWMHRLPPVHA